MTDNCSQVIPAADLDAWIARLKADLATAQQDRAYCAEVKLHAYEVRSAQRGSGVEYIDWLMGPGLEKAQAAAVDAALQQLVNHAGEASAPDPRAHSPLSTHAYEQALERCRVASEQIRAAQRVAAAFDRPADAAIGRRLQEVEGWLAAYPAWQAKLVAAKEEEDRQRAALLDALANEYLLPSGSGKASSDGGTSWSYQAGVLTCQNLRNQPSAGAQTWKWHRGDSKLVLEHSSDSAEAFPSARQSHAPGADKEGQPYKPYLCITSKYGDYGGFVLEKQDGLVSFRDSGSRGIKWVLRGGILVPEELGEKLNAHRDLIHAVKLEGDFPLPLAVFVGMLPYYQAVLMPEWKK